MDFHPAVSQSGKGQEGPKIKSHVSGNKSDS